MKKNNEVDDISIRFKDYGSQCKMAVIDKANKFEIQLNPDRPWQLTTKSTFLLLLDDECCGLRLYIGDDCHIIKHSFFPWQIPVKHEEKKDSNFFLFALVISILLIILWAWTN